MKRICILLITALFAQKMFCLESLKQLVFYEGIEYKTEIDNSTQLSTDKKEDSAQKIQNVCSAKCTTTHAAAFVSAKGEGKELFSSINKGISIHTEPLFSQYRIYAFGGNITYSGAASRLKSPKLTFSSSLKKFSVPKYGLEPSLPTRSSSNKTDSACIKLVPQKSTLPQIEAAYINNGTFLASASAKFSTKNIPLIQTGLTGGVFTNTKGSSSWFDKIPRFTQRFYPAAELSFAAVTQSFRTSGIFSYYKTPFDTSPLLSRNSFCSRIQTSFIAGLFSLSADLFTSSSAFITADGTFCHTPFQFSLNPQRIFSVQDYVIRAGLLGALSLDTASFFSNDLCPSYKLRADASVTHDNSSFSLYSVYSSSIDDSDSAAEKSLSLTGRLSVKQKSFSWAVKGAASFSGISSSLQTQVYSASGNVSFSKGVFSSLAAAASVAVKNGSFYRGTFSTDIVLGTRNSGSNKKDKNPFKKMKFTVKAGISLTF